VSLVGQAVNDLGCSCDICATLRRHGATPLHLTAPPLFSPTEEQWSAFNNAVTKPHPDSDWVEPWDVIANPRRQLTSRERTRKRSRAKRQRQARKRQR